MYQNILKEENEVNKDNTQKGRKGKKNPQKQAKIRHETLANQINAHIETHFQMTR